MMRKTLVLLILALALSPGLMAQGPTPAVTKSYMVGGLLYAGNFPINNPFNTGDAGYAILYKLEKYYISAVDSVVFDSLGYFYFLDVKEGQYLIKAGLKENSAQFKGFMPAYYNAAGDWTHADTLSVNADQYAADIRMFPVAASMEGQRAVSGFIYMEEPEDHSSRVRGCEVVLADTLYHPLACTYTDGSGVFSFSGLGNGTYYVYAEYTGKFSQKEFLTLDETHPFSDDLEIRLFTPVQGVQSPPEAKAPLLTAWPNPASGRVQVGIGTPAGDYTLALCSVMGREVLSQKITATGGAYSGTLSLEGLPPGIYILTATKDSSGSRAMKKLIVY
jgi:hypothetical protein